MKGEVTVVVSPFFFLYYLIICHSMTDFMLLNLLIIIIYVDYVDFKNEL